MSLKVSQSGGDDFEIIPEGQYTARCFKVIDLGTQTIEWQGEEKLQPKIVITWEILDEPKMKDGRPFAISKTYTLSLHEKSNLYKDLTAWRGKSFTPDELLGFDITNLVGAYCQIQVVHNKSGDRTYANVNALMGTKEKPEGVNDEVIFDVNNPDMEVFESFGDYYKNKIRDSEEWKAREIATRPRKDNKIDANDIDIDKDITIEEVGEPQDDEIDPKDIPF